MPNTFGDYSHTSSAAVGGSGSASAGKSKVEYWPLDRCKKAYTNYTANKSEEIEEQKNARRYYHGAHWTAEQIRELNKRKQPVVTFNRIAHQILYNWRGWADRTGSSRIRKPIARTPQGADKVPAVGNAPSFSLLNWIANNCAGEVSGSGARCRAVEGLAGISVSIWKKATDKEASAYNDVRIFRAAAYEWHIVDGPQRRPIDARSRTMRLASMWLRNG